MSLLRAIKVTYSNGEVRGVNMASNLTDTEMLNHFAVGKEFNLGNVEDDVQTVVKREILK